MTSQVMFCNINGLYSHHALLCDLLAQTCPAVMAVAETHIHRDNHRDNHSPLHSRRRHRSRSAVDDEQAMKRWQIQDYEMVRVPSPAAVCEGNGGLAFYIRNGVSCRLLTAPAFLPPSIDTVTQIAWVEVCLPTRALIGVCYLHPNATAADLDQVLQSCSAIQLSFPSVPTLLLGDFNAQHPSWGSDLVKGHGAWVNSHLLSGANGTGLAWDCMNMRFAGSARKFTHNVSEWQVAAVLCGQEHFDSAASIERCLDDIRTAMIAAAGCVYGRRRSSISPQRRDWWLCNTEVQQAKAKVNETLRQWKLNPTEATRIARNSARRDYRHTVNRVKSGGWRDFTSQIEGEHKHVVWNIWKRSQGATSQAALHHVADSSGVLPVNATQALNNLMAHYSATSRNDSIYTDAHTEQRVASLLCTDPSNSTYPGRQPDESDDAVWTTDEVRKACQHVNVTKAFAGDGIHPMLIKHAGEVTYQLLTQLLNSIWSTSYVPAAWKQADICSLFKKGAKTDPNNYRPISLTSVLGRIMERLVLKRLMPCIDTCFSRFQFGFRHGRCTLDNLAVIQQRIYKALHSKGCSQFPVAFLDLNKAFDKVDHRYLLYKLSAQFKVNGHMWSYIQSFLSHRQARTILRDLHSDWMPMQTGVPQGSVLGPVLFLIYINDLLLQIERHTRCDPLAFADDLALLPRTSSSHRSDTHASIRKALRFAGQWAVKWKMKFNIGEEKSAVVMFRTRGSEWCAELASEQSFVLRVRNSDGSKCKLAVPFVDNYKYLGVWLNAFGNTERQMQHLRVKLRRASFLVSRLLWNAHPLIAITLVNMVIRPIFSYGLAFWNPSDAQLWEFNRYMAQPLRRALGLPVSAHTIGVLALCGIPCAHAIAEQARIQTAVRVMSLTRSNPAHSMMSHALHKEYSNKEMKRIPLACHIQRWLTTVVDAPVGGGEENMDSTATAALTTWCTLPKKQLKMKIDSWIQTRAYAMWRERSIAWMEKHHASTALLKHCYTGSQQKQILCEPFLKHDDRQTARLRSRLLLSRASFAQRRHAYANTSAQYAPSADCAWCGVGTVESAEHILLQCPRFDQLRYELQVHLYSSFLTDLHVVFHGALTMAMTTSASTIFSSLFPHIPSTRRDRHRFLRAVLEDTGHFLRCINSVHPF